MIAFLGLSPTNIALGRAIALLFGDVKGVNMEKFLFGTEIPMF